jgi:ABC-type branched-subunit amino acid transport system ATPase component/branched-subunit amino acid ABC-type transport system permease component
VKNFIEFAILGLGIGGVYGLLGNGLVLIYRGSGVVNFAHGAMAMAAAYIFYELSRVDGWPVWSAVLVSVAILTCMGLVTQLGLMRRLRNSSAVARLIATLGVLAVLDGVFSIWFGASSNTAIPAWLPHASFDLAGYTVSEYSLWLLGIAVVTCFGLYAWSRHTALGLAMVAVAESPEAASTLGWSPQAIATLAWASGAALAGIAGILIVPVTGLVITNLTLIVVDALAAALLGGFVSFPVVLVAGVVIGIAQSEMAFYVSQAGWSDALPFLVIILVLLIRGRALPVRGHVLERLPRLGTGQFRPLVVVPLTVVLAVCIATFFPLSVTTAVTVELAVAVILLSIVVVTGYAGQLSLAQYSLAGVGALVAGRIAAVEGWPFLACLVCGIVAAAAVGAVCGIPALRIRGVNLAIVTLGLGVALEELVFLNPNYTGGIEGTVVQPPSIFGLSLNPITEPNRYAIFCLILFALAAIVVANVRRSRSGRRLVAVRANERAAASLGVSVTGAKLYAFSLGAGLAGLGGILLAFMNPVLEFNSFDPLTSANFVGYATIGGIGHIAGPLFGSGFQSGGIGSVILDQFGSLDTWLPLIGGVFLVGVLLQNPDGVAGAHLPAALRRAGASARLARFTNLPPGLAARRRSRASRAAVPAAGASEIPRRPESGDLVASGIRVRFGGVVAVNDVSLRVAAGEVVGLIGPNGAGKTTLIDAITGFVPAEAGSVRLGSAGLDRLPAFRRARSGLARTFQSLELFEDFSVEENFRVASDSRDRLAYLTNLVHRGTMTLAPVALAAIQKFELEGLLDRSPRDLPYGVRRLVGIVRSVATGPAILLLDEPAAGLNDNETAELARLIRQLTQEAGMGILLVEHDMQLVMEVCDRITVLDFGKVIAEGTPDEIRSNPLVVDAYLGSADADSDAGASGPLGDGRQSRTEAV